MKVAVIGGGPSGSVAAALLARRGHDIVIFDQGGRPELVVGESLVPGVIPILTRLQLEERVAEISIKKPGVSFYPQQGNEFAFSFASLPSKYPAYAYNVPRPAFDRLLEESALASGARKVSARVELTSEGDRLCLAPELLSSVSGWNGEQPDFIIDASGRRRLSAGHLNIRATLGPRRDVSHFAHYEGFDEEKPRGQVRINRLQHGWAWRIPLRGKMSFGIVMDQKSAAHLGETPEKRLDAVLAGDPQLRAETSNPRRVSSVQTYGNYQLISSRGVGENWASVGDAFGFVDPMLSPGMMLALESASLLDQELAARPLAEALAQYAMRISENLKAWMELIEYFYDGRIFQLRDIGRAMQVKYPYLPLGFMESFMSSNMASMASGFTTASPWNRGVLRYADQYILGSDQEASHYAIS